ncbi:MAG: hypothetical protein U5L04_16445 [Trueperaceae bacterium]|nr:hypothetical protein [Trueperaceae bacterium]
MKKYLVLAVLLFAPMVWAQGGVVTAGAESNLYAGASLGLDFFADEEFSLDGYFGFRDLLATNVDLRANVGIILGGIDLTTLGASAIYNIDSGSNVTPYLGGGLRVFFNGDTDLGIGFVGGADIGLSDRFDLFTEFKSDVFFDGGSYGGIAVGGKYNF